MLNFVKSNIAILFSVLALTVSGCTSLGLTPLPNPYAEVETVAEGTLVSIKSFGAVQETLIDTCEYAVAGTDEATTCVALISVEQVLRPAVTAAGQIGAEYSDIDARIKQAGPEAPAEWLALAAEAAGRLSAAYEPIKDDVAGFIDNVGGLTD